MKGIVPRGLASAVSALDHKTDNSGPRPVQGLNIAGKGCYTRSISNGGGKIERSGDTPNCTHRTVMLLPCGRMLPDRGRWREYGCRGGAAWCRLKAPCVSPEPIRRPGQ